MLRIYEVLGRDDYDRRRRLNGVRRDKPDFFQSLLAATLWVFDKGGRVAAMKHFRDGLENPKLRNAYPPEQDYETHSTSTPRHRSQSIVTPIRDKVWLSSAEVCAA